MKRQKERKENSARAHWPIGIGFARGQICRDEGSKLTRIPPSPQPPTSSSWRKRKKKEKGIRNREKPRSLPRPLPGGTFCTAAFSGSVWNGPQVAAAMCCCYDYSGCLFAFTGRQRASGSGHPFRSVAAWTARATYKWNKATRGQNVKTFQVRGRERVVVCASAATLHRNAEQEGAGPPELFIVTAGAGACGYSRAKTGLAWPLPGRHRFCRNADNETAVILREAGAV